MMLFERRLREGIADGSLTVMFRRWRRTQAVAGHRYRTGGPMIEVSTVSEVVTPDQITAEDVQAAGYPDRAALLADVRGAPDAPLFRIVFRRLDEPDPRDVLAAEADLTAEQRAELRSRLARLDAVRPSGPWTAATLAAIAARPRIRAAELAALLGRPTAPFKADVRKLKALGLTQSLEIGYCLSPRGTAYLTAGDSPFGGRPALTHRARR